MKKTLFYAVSALLFVPYAAFLLVGGLAVLIGKLTARLHQWTHAELYREKGNL